MTNARHNAIPNGITQLLKTKTGRIVLNRPADLPQDDAVRLVRDIFGVDHTSVVAPGGALGTPSVTPYGYGRDLMIRQFEVQTTADDPQVITTLRDAVTTLQLPLHPDRVVALWKDSSQLPARVAKDAGLSDAQRDGLNRAFDDLNRLIEEIFTRNGTTSMTGQLHLPVMLNLKGPSTIIAAHSAEHPLTQRTNLLMQRTLGERLVIVTHQTGVPSWNLAFND